MGCQEKNPYNYNKSVTKLLFLVNNFNSERLPGDGASYDDMEEDDGLDGLDGDDLAEDGMY